MEVGHCGASLGGIETTLTPPVVEMPKIINTCQEIPFNQTTTSCCGGNLKDKHQWVKNSNK